MFAAAALYAIRFEFRVDMVGQRFTMPGQLVDQRRVVRFDKLVEKCLLGLMPFVGNVAKALPALCQHAGCDSETNGSERASLYRPYSGILNGIPEELRSTSVASPTTIAIVTPTPPNASATAPAPKPARSRRLVGTGCEAHES